MVVRRNKKIRRQRGGRSHGWGIQKDHKGAGMRGGRGNAGVTQHQWIQTVKKEKAERRKIIGKYGFKRPQEFQGKYQIINVSHLDQSIDTLVKTGKAKLVDDVYEVNLDDLGITKLLAQGNIVRKIKINVKIASERAVTKVTEAGGQVSIIS